MLLVMPCLNLLVFTRIRHCHRPCTRVWKWTLWSCESASSRSMSPTGLQPGSGGESRSCLGFQTSRRTTGKDSTFASSNSSLIASIRIHAGRKSVCTALSQVASKTTCFTIYLSHPLSWPSTASELQVSGRYCSIRSGASERLSMTIHHLYTKPFRFLCWKWPGRHDCAIDWHLWPRRRLLLIRSPLERFVGGPEELRNQRKPPQTCKASTGKSVPYLSAMSDIARILSLGTVRAREVYAVTSLCHSISASFGSKITASNRVVFPLEPLKNIAIPGGNGIFLPS